MATSLQRSKAINTGRRVNCYGKTELGSLRDARHTHRHTRPASWRTRDLFSAAGVHAHFWNQGRSPRGCLYDGRASKCVGDWVASKGKNLRLISNTHGHDA